MPIPCMSTLTIHQDILNQNITKYFIKKVGLDGKNIFKFMQHWSQVVRINVSETVVNDHETSKC